MQQGDTFDKKFSHTLKQEADLRIKQGLDDDNQTEIYEVITRFAIPKKQTKMTKEVLSQNFMKRLRTKQEKDNRIQDKGKIYVPIEKISKGTDRKFLVQKQSVEKIKRKMNKFYEMKQL